MTMRDKVVSPDCLCGTELNIEDWGVFKERLFQVTQLDPRDGYVRCSWACRWYMMYRSLKVCAMLYESHGNLEDVMLQI